MVLATVTSRLVLRASRTCLALATYACSPRRDTLRRFTWVN